MGRSDVLALLLVVVGCGGSTANEHGASDAGTDAPADAGGEFCQGASKLELGGKLALDVPVTSSLTPVMTAATPRCCACTRRARSAAISISR